MSSSFTKSNMIEWKFGEKHKEYIRRCKVNNMNIAEGAVRAGKTIDNIFAFAMELETSPDKIHVATGSTLANAKLNIAEANGYGLKHIFRGRHRMGKFEGYECIYVNTKMGERIVIFAGASKANSYEKIRGNSYGMWIATEINLHHAQTIEECFNRTLMARKSKVFWDLNPSNPRHPIYTEHIDRYLEKHESGGLAGGYNYQHFTIYDNTSLTEDKRLEIVDRYVEDSVWYRRDILGQRAVAEGLIYPKFADDNSAFLVNSEDVPRLRSITIGVDFGQSLSRHAFVATGLSYDNKVYILASKLLGEGVITEDVAADEYVDFLKFVESKFGRIVDYTYGDSARSTAIECLNKSLRNAGLSRSVWHSIKLKVNERVSGTNVLMSEDRIFYTELAESARDSFNSAIWNTKFGHEDERLDFETDVLDAFEYSLERDLNELVGLD